jgi:hypothetical protein
MASLVRGHLFELHLELRLAELFRLPVVFCRAQASNRRIV